jgi:hypothetical protein
LIPVSTDTDSTNYTEQELRNRFSEVVQGKAQKSKVLHLPDPDADDPEPMCDRHTSNGWRAVSVTSFPIGHRPFCDYCKRRLREQDEAEESSASSRSATGEFSTGNALEAEWG